MMAARLLISSQVVAFQLAVRAQDYEDDVNVAYLADLKLCSGALTAAPRAMEREGPCSSRRGRKEAARGPPSSTLLFRSGGVTAAGNPSKHA